MGDQGLMAEPVPTYSVTAAVRKAAGLCVDQRANDVLILNLQRVSDMTDYFVMPLPFQDATRTSTMSFASIREGGFSTLDLERLQMAARIWSSVAERWVLRHIALDLLAHYLGRAPAERRAASAPADPSSRRRCR